MLIKGRPNLTGQIEHGSSHSSFRFFEAAFCHPFSQRQIENIEKAHDRRKLEIRTTASDRKCDDGIEKRVLQKTRLHQIGLSNAELGVLRLHFSVIPKRHLRGLFSSEFPLN